MLLLEEVLEVVLETVLDALLLIRRSGICRLSAMVAMIHLLQIGWVPFHFE
jgi:hypothetical protein